MVILINVAPNLTPYIVIRILLTLFPVPYLYHHESSVATNLYFLILSPFPPIPPTTLPSGNHQNVVCIWVCFCSHFLNIFFKIELLICIYCHFIVQKFNIFFLLLEDLLTFHITLTRWWWTLLAFSCLGSSLFVLRF